MPILIYLSLASQHRTFVVTMASMLMFFWLPIGYLSDDMPFNLYRNMVRGLIFSILVLLSVYLFSLSAFALVEGAGWDAALAGQLSFLITIPVLVMARPLSLRATLLERWLLGKTVINDAALERISQEMIRKPDLDHINELIRETLAELKITDYALLIHDRLVFSTRKENISPAKFYPINFEEVTIGQIGIFDGAERLSDYEDYQLRLFTNIVSVGIHLARFVSYSTDLAGKLLSASVEERAKMSAEFHNGPLQLLTNVIVTMRSAGSQELERYVSQLSSVTKQIRHFLKELSPLMSHDDLRTIILYESDRLEREPVELMLDLADLSRPLNREITMAYFQIFREAINNVLKHAAADRVWVSLREEGKRLILRIEDDGRGFEPAQAAVKETLGMNGLRFWANSIQGRLSILSEPGGGTAVELVSEPERLMDGMFRFS